MNLRREESGSTLMEVLMVAAFMGIILTGVYTFYLFGYRTFRTGQDKVYLNHNLRLAAEIITREIRYATCLSLLEDWSELPSEPEDVITGAYYIYFDRVTGTVVTLNQNSRRQITDPVISGVSFSLDGNILYYKLEAFVRNTEYTLESNVLLLNNRSPLTPEAPLPALFYTKP